MESWNRPAKKGAPVRKGETIHDRNKRDSRAKGNVRHKYHDVEEKLPLTW
jgi:hypothetical protein